MWVKISEHAAVRMLKRMNVSPRDMLTRARIALREGRRMSNRAPSLKNILVVLHQGWRWVFRQFKSMYLLITVTNLNNEWSNRMNSTLRCHPTNTVPVSNMMIWKIEGRCAIAVHPDECQRMFPSTPCKYIQRVMSLVNQLSQTRKPNDL